jgi:NAD(P)-dependent dehydrogenase (short-subunit alcohol dehydrogenase family)
MTLSNTGPAEIDLAGQTSLVTGATSGIGRAAAVLLARRGAHVLVSGRDAERGDAVVAEIRIAGGRADFVAADLADADSVRALARRAVELGGGHVGILVNNAGVFPFGPTQGATDECIDAVYAVNVKAPFILTGELAPAMAARGKGSIINVLTMVAHFGVAGMALYGSSKAALTLLTKAWSAEFGPRGVRVNAVSPRTDPHRGYRGDGRPAGPARRAGPGRAPGRPGRNRLGHQLPGRRPGQLRPRRGPRRRRRPPRSLAVRARRPGPGPGPYNVCGLCPDKRHRPDREGNMTTSAGPRYDDLSALFFNCTLKPSPQLSNTQGLIDLSAAIMLKHGGRVETIRAAALRRRAAQY